MKKLVTKLKSTGLRLALAVFSTVGLSAVTAVGQPSLPWCNSNHYYHTAYYSPSAYMNAIEQVKVETTAGSLIYNKNPDGPNFTQGVCQSDWKLVNTPSKSFTLIAGSSYVVSVSGSSKNGYTSMVIGLWIDLNKDYTFSSSEYLTTSWTASFTNGGTPGSLSAKTIKIPCGITAGATRMRIVTDYQYGSMNSSYGCNGVCNGSNPNYGETEDFSIDLALPTTITADFVAPATAFIKTNVKFLNKDKTNIFNDWDADVNGYNYSPSTGGAASPIDPDYQFTWNTTGNKCVKLRATNCLGKDSIVKCFNVVAPTQIPVADFIASATKIEQYQTAQLFDLSTQGPYQWTWSVYDSSNLLDIKDLASGYVYPINGTTTASQNPIFSFDAAGCYTVLLTTKNDVGLSKRVMKKCYITVVEPTQYNLCYGPNKSESSTGTVYDYGGPNLPYTNINADPGCARLTITPCNAKKIKLTFTKIKLGAGHFVSVYDAAFKDKSKLLYTITNADKPKLPFTITALSGSMYIDMEGSSGTVDSGFAAFYKSELGTGTPPIANFAPATIPGYNRVPLRHTNLSNNLAGVPKYTWTIDGSPVSAGETIAMPDGRVDMIHTFFTDGQYEICLDIESCTGKGHFCKTEDIVTPNTPTQLDFTASNLRPSTGDLVTMTTVSDKADKFLWSIFPLTYTLQAGSTLKSKNPVMKFNNAGKYTFTLRAWNSNDSANTVTVKIKDKYVVVLDYCKPLSQLLSADVAINRVIITDKNNNVLLDNTTDGGTKSYTDYSADQIATVTFGATYSLEQSRLTAVDPASRKVYIDFNIDGDFDDAGEDVSSLSETSANTLSKKGTFTVPALKNAFEGVARLRVVINYSTNTITPCGPIVAGEYEDYAIRMVNDNLAPKLTLNGADTVRIEKCKPYTDMWATAIDPTEGDITSRIVMTTDLDSCTSGIYTTEFNVEDASGNKAVTVRRTIIVVEDRTLPVITVGGANPYYIEATRTNAPYTEPGIVSATDNSAPYNLTPSIIVTGNVNTRVVGTYILNYDVQDVQGNKDHKTRTVIVSDNTAPVPDLAGSEKIQINELWVDQTSATDAYDLYPRIIRTPGYNGDVNTLKKATYPISYVMVDSSGNATASIVRNYVVDDYIAPTITFSGAQGKVYVHDVNTPYVSEKPEYSDNYYPNSSVSLVPLNAGVVKSNILGTYTENWKAEDASGNVTIATRTVKVVDRQAPVINADIIHGCVGSDIRPYEGVSTTDNYYGPAILAPLVEVISSNVNIWQAGIYTITYRVTDPSNNTSLPFTRLVSFTYWPNCSEDIRLGVNDVAIEDAVSLYPNPTSGNFTIDLKGNVTDKLTVDIYNTLGAKVSSVVTEAGMSTYSADLSNFASGIYVVKMNIGGTVVTRKITKD